MKQVAKYNTYKGVSTLLTLGTPTITLACCGEFFVHRSDTAISAAGMFALILLFFLFKDKIAEHWKVPSAFVMSLAVFVLIITVEKIMLPVKYVCITTMIATGLDEITFKRFYKQLEALMPEQAQLYKHLGFIFTSSKTLETIKEESKK